MSQAPIFGRFAHRLVRVRQVLHRAGVTEDDVDNRSGRSVANREATLVVTGG